jgi:hydroxypyruvate reductase
MTQEAEAKTLLRRLFDTAIAAADPARTMAAHLPPKPKGRCVAVGCGKAAAVMAAALDTLWPDVALSGVVVTRDGQFAPAGRIEVLQASHPVPDSRSEAAAMRILNSVQGLSKNDLVLALISGGGSALMSLPAPGITHRDKQAVGKALLASGATIAEINIVRRSMSAIKGGRLAAAALPARLVTLAISDVPGDDPLTIASGPTVAAPAEAAEAIKILDRYGIMVAATVKTAIVQNRPPPLPDLDYRLIASPRLALNAAAQAAQKAGFYPLILGDALEGEAREAGRVLASIASCAARYGLPAQPPCVLLSGGETTVTLGPNVTGTGGRNTEFLLAAALQWQGQKGIFALAADTDGIDGSADTAGAFVTPSTLARAAAAGLNVRDFLDRHDSYGFFMRLNDLLITGPTCTNVNDFRAILVF